jgi:hypothetical protein
VYDCSQDEFFLAQEEVNRNDPFFVCTLQIDPVQASKFTKVVTHKSNNDLVFVLGQDYILKFDLSAVANGALNSDDKTKKVQPVDAYRLTQTTYDRIIDISINRDDVEQSWVSL